MNQYFIIAALIAVVMAGVTGAFFGYRYSEGQHAQAQVEQLQEDVKEVKALEDKTEKTKIVVQEKIKVIRETVDDCKDQPAPATILNGV